MRPDPIDFNEYPFEGILLKALGTGGLGVRPVGGGGVPIDGDGDGKYTAVRGGEDNVPMPPGAAEAIREAIAWADLNDIVDWEEFIAPENRGKIKVQQIPPEQQEELARNLADAFVFWKVCQAIRRKAYELAGADPGAQGADPGINYRPPDPMVDRVQQQRFADMVSGNQDLESARFIMGRLVLDARAGRTADRRFYRAIPVGAGQADEGEFLSATQVGNILDIPLLSFMDRRREGNVEVLSEFGTDYLFEVEPGMPTFPGATMAAYYVKRDEDNAIRGIKGLVKDLERGKVPAGLSKDKDVQKRLADALANFRANQRDDGEKRAKAIQELKDAMLALGLDPSDTRKKDKELFRFQGEKVNATATSGDRTYALRALANPGGEGVPQEHVGGGRFEVVSVEDDPFGTFKKVIKLRHVGVFDPQNKGVVVENAGSDKPIKGKSAKDGKPEPIVLNLPSFDIPMGTPKAFWDQIAKEERERKGQRQRVGANGTSPVSHLTENLRTPRNTGKGNK